MSYGRGHVVKGAKQRKLRQATIDRYKALGEAIAKQLEGKTTAELLTWNTRR